MKKFLLASPAHPRGYSGFSLIETIVAITLLAIAILGPMALSGQSIRASREARSELIATHLVEEGVEVVHSIRDNNSADDTSVGRDEWMDSILNECDSGCIADITDHSGSDVWGNKALDKCNGSCDGRVYYNPTTGLYRQTKNGLNSPWVATEFTRIVTTTEVAADKQVRVVSEVTYPSYKGTRTISVSEDLYNWFPSFN